MAHILIAEDEDGIARVMQRALRGEGHRTTIVTDGLSVLEQAAAGGVDLVVLDVGLPRMDGFTVLRMLRGMQDHLPVIMCTARNSVEDTVTGLDSGADDYLAKPFRVEELLARVRLRLRQAAERGTTPEQELTAGELALNPAARTLRVGGVVVDVSAREFDLAHVLIEHAGQVLSRDQLLDLVWGYEVTGSSNVVDVYIRYLRAKIGADRISTVRGVGYRLDA